MSSCMSNAIFRYILDAEVVHLLHAIFMHICAIFIDASDATDMHTQYVTPTYIYDATFIDML